MVQLLTTKNGTDAFSLEMTVKNELNMEYDMRCGEVKKKRKSKKKKKNEKKCNPVDE